MRLSHAAASLVLGLATASLPTTFAAAADDVMAFPDACRLKTTNKAPAAAPASGHAGHGAAKGPAMKDHQQASMAGMTTMDRDMADGMMQDDADIAFICGMIAHHQGAIAMSEVQLKFGKDAFARDMAQTIIAAQKQEIADMKSWLAKTVRK